MRVLYILHTNSLTDGSTKSFLALVDGMAAAGAGVEPYIVLPGDGALSSLLRSKGMRVFALNYRFSIYPHLRRWQDWLLFLPRLAYWQWLEHRAVRHVTAICRDNGVDLIHSNVSVVAIGMKVAHRLHLPCVYHLREYGGQTWGMHYFPSHRSYLAAMQRAGAYTVCITRDVQRYYGLCDDGRSRVIYNGLFPAAYRPAPSSTDGNYFLFAGRIEAAKGVQMLLEAYRLYAASCKDALPLWLAGREPDASAYVRSLHAYVEQHGLEGKVIFLGERTDIYILMQQARAIVVASPLEGFGRCTAEAMYNGCLVVGRDTCGTKEQMDNGVSLTGDEIALRFTTTQQLAAHLKECASAPRDAYDAMRQRAATTVRRLYSTEANVRGVHRLYCDILSTTKSNAR